MYSSLSCTGWVFLKNGAHVYACMHVTAYVHVCVYMRGCIEASVCMCAYACERALIDKLHNYMYSCVRNNLTYVATYP